MYVCICIYVYVHIYVCDPGCWEAVMYVCMYVCIVCLQYYSVACMHQHICICVCTCMHHIYVYVYVCAYICHIYWPKRYMHKCTQTNSDRHTIYSLSWSLLCNGVGAHAPLCTHHTYIHSTHVKKDSDWLTIISCHGHFRMLAPMAELGGCIYECVCM